MITPSHLQHAIEFREFRELTTLAMSTVLTHLSSFCFSLRKEVCCLCDTLAFLDLYNYRLIEQRVLFMQKIVADFDLR